MYTHNLDPVLFDFGFLVIRWYSLAYIFGILIGWYLGKRVILGRFKNLNFDIKNVTPYFTILIAILLVSKIPTLSFKKISISPKSTVFILLAIGTTFISLLYFTFETLFSFGLLYLVLIPVSYIMYKKQDNQKKLETLEDEHEDVL